MQFSQRCNIEVSLSLERVVRVALGNIRSHQREVDAPFLGSRAFSYVGVSMIIPGIQSLGKPLTSMGTDLLSPIPLVY